MRQYIKSRIILLITILAVAIVVVLGFIYTQPTINRASSNIIGYDGSPLLGTFYYAIEHSKGDFTKLRFRNSSDIGYSLLSGTIQAGFVEPYRVAEMQHLRGFEKLETIGGIVFPYGVSLVVRKDLQVRLSDIASLELAISDQDTKLLDIFLQDINKYDIKSPIKESIIVLSSDAIIPALESKAIDGVIVKGSHAIIAQLQGHHVLYQKWDVEAGDECCPPIVEQMVYILLVDKDWQYKNQFKHQINSTKNIDKKEINDAISKHLNLSSPLLEEIPVASFKLFTNDEKQIIEQHAGRHHQKEKKSTKEHTCSSSCKHH